MLAVQRDMLIHTHTVQTGKFTYTLAVHREILAHNYTVHREKLNNMLAVLKDMIQYTEISLLTMNMLQR